MISVHYTTRNARWIRSVQEMLRAVREDNSLDAEALLLAGLYANTTFEVDDSTPQLKEGSTLLHAAAVFGAPLCAQARPENRYARL